MGTTVKTYSYNGSVITNTSVGVKFTDGSVSPKNWEEVWTDQEKKDKGITWTTNTNWSGGSEAAEKKIQLRQQRNMLLQDRDWETLMDRVENGETIGVENKNGERAVMAPADDELIRLYTDHEEAS